MATMTLDTKTGYTTQRLVAETTRVTIYNASNYALNGTFVVQKVVNSTQFTYTLPLSASASAVGAGVRLADASAIELDNPHLPWDVSGNLFANYGVLINDNQCPPG